MKEHRQFHYSTVDFRRNPCAADPGDIHLGVILGFTTSMFKVIGLALREPIQSHYLDGLDDLSKEMIGGRSVILEREIRCALQDTGSPQSILVKLAERNPWSIHITPPIVIDAQASNDTATVERVAQDYVFTLYRQRLVPARQASLVFAEPTPVHSYRFAPIANFQPTDDENGIAEIPPAWMLPPKLWMIPDCGP